MKPPFAQHKILPVHLPTVLTALLAVAAAAAWVGLHALKRRVRMLWLRALLFAARVGVGFVALLAAMDVLQRGLVFATNWPIWPLALAGAATVEVLLVLYALERRVVSPKVSVALAALRISLALLVVVMLAQPVRSTESTKSIQRYVAVLVDDSASMHVPDKQMTPAEKIRLAEVLSPQTPRRAYRFESLARRLGGVLEELNAQVDWLASLREAKPETRLKQLEKRRRDVQHALEAQAQTIAELSNEAAKPFTSTLKLDPQAHKALRNVANRLTQEARRPLEQAAAAMDKGNLASLAREYGPLLVTLRRAAVDIEKLKPDLLAVGDALDAALFRSLSDEERANIDAVCLRARSALARHVLRRPLAKPGTTQTTPGLLEQLSDDYGVKLYTFASEPVEVELDQGLQPDAAPAEPDELPDEQQKTDLAAALNKVITEVPAERLAGILLLTDGQHNAPSRVEPQARSIGLQRVPICSIVFGAGAKPTTDAAIVGCEAPETVYAKDKMYLNAELKLDGLAGKTVRVTLYDGDEPVDSEEIPVQADKLRTRVQLADAPKETGLHDYRIKVEDIEGEVLTTNNEHPVSVGVSDERTKLLLVEGRARWEFRYIKNIFASRDRTVKLQYVLLHPDEIPGQPPRPKVPASVARPEGDAEATAPPENEAEWMKFDVIVLGDVEPTVLRDEDRRAIKKFVEERAGTLIVIAGPYYMPHAYANTPLADILPVAFEDVGEEVSLLASPEKSFRIELTPEGRDSVITRLRVDPEENLETWNSLPDLHWRHALTRAKEGATVIASALPPEPPEFLKPKRPHEVPDEQTVALRRQFVRDHALITTHQVALGQVLFLSTDRTWRLRYRVGDTHHHRFWGQVLRWATADKLPAGSSLVKLGADRPRYPPHANVRVRAKITQADYTPVISDEVAAQIFAGDKLVLRKKMDYVPNSLGMYAADLGQLAAGTYRFELAAPAAQRILASEGVEKVEARFSVESAIPAEQVELAADRGLLERLATLTNGVVADLPEATETLAALGAPTLTHRDRRQWVIWDSWPFLALIVVVAGAEWLVRKRARLP